MPDNNETTTRFRVDISELKKAMQEAKRQVAVANSEFKAVSSTMEDWTKSTDGISAKLKQLDSNLKSQTTILNSLEAQYEEVVRTQGEGSKAADDLRIKINNQKAVINQTEREISKYEQSLEEVAEAEKVAARTGKSVAEVLDDVGEAADDAGDGFTVLKGAVATFAGNVMSSLVGSLKDAAGSLLGLADSTREYRDQMSKLESASKDAGYGVDYAKDKYEELYGVLADETASSTAVSNLMAMNAEEDTLNSLVDSSIGIWAKFGDSIPLDGLAEAINHTSQLGSVQGNLADALEWSGVTVDDFNKELEKCSTEQERQELIADKLNGLYGDLSDSYKESNKSIINANKANAKYTDNMAKLGAKVEPITTKLKEGFNSVLEKILELTEDVDFSVFTKAAEKAFTVLTDTVLPAVKNGLGWIIDNKDIVIAGLAGIAAGFLAFKVVGIIQAVSTAMQGMTLAQYALNLAMSLNPIGIVVALLAGLVAAIVVLWNKSDAFREFFINLWETITNAIGVAVDSIAGFFSGLWEGIKSIWSGVSSWFNSKVIQPVVNTFSGLWRGLKNGASDAWSGIKSVFSKVGSFFKDTFTNAWTAVKNVFSVGGKIFDGIKDGIVTAFKTIVNGIIRGINKVVSVPFNAINGVLKKIKKVSVAGIKPFDWIGTISVPEIPELEYGGVLKRGQVGLLEGKGAEAVVPLERNLGWIRNIARQLAVELGISTGTVNNKSVKSNVVNNFYQTNNSPKSLSRVEIYRQTKNLLGYAGGVK